MGGESSVYDGGIIDLGEGVDTIAPQDFVIRSTDFPMTIIKIEFVGENSEDFDLALPNGQDPSDMEYEMTAEGYTITIGASLNEGPEGKTTTLIITPAVGEPFSVTITATFQQE